jgi:RNA polymerase sigma factor (sigma-70 family)
MDDEIWRIRAGVSPFWGAETMIRVMDAARDFELVFGPLYRQARHVAWRLLGDQADAEDAAAEAMARALVAWDRVGSLPYRDAWVMRVAANVAIDMARRRDRRAAPPLARPSAPPAGDMGEDVALGLDIRHALVGLSKRQREVVILRWIAGLTEQEVAGCLNLSRSAVKSHTRRGLDALREQLGGEVGYVAV